MRRMHLVASAAVLVSFALGSTAVAKPPDVDSSKLRAAVTVEGIVAAPAGAAGHRRRHRRDAPHETPGFPASVEYVRETMENAGWNVSIYAVRHAGLGGDARRRSSSS